MLNNQYILPLNGELAIDLFAGGGGASTGIEMAIGRHVDNAINHDPEALGMHEVNHPQTRHHIEDIWKVIPSDVTQGSPAGLVWASPTCTHYSKARGGKPVNKQLRSQAWVVVKWAGQVKPRVIFLENVEEFKTWGPLIAARDKKTGRCFKFVGYKKKKPIYEVAAKGERVPLEKQQLIPDKKRAGDIFKKWVNVLRGLGYKIEWKELRACDYGAPTIRKRLFLIARRDGQPIVWPEATHGDPKKAETKKKGLKPWRTAAECIDWSIPCPSIFDRKKPLSENTLRRIALGIKKYVLDNPAPFIVTNTSGHPGAPLSEPLRTITTGGHHALINPVIVGIANNTKQMRSTNDPLSTITAWPRGGHHALIAPIVAQVGYGDVKGQRTMDAENPLWTVVSNGNHVALVSAFLAKHFTGAIGSELEKPLGTVTSVDHNALVTAFLIKYYGNEKDGNSLKEPAVIIDIGMRMLGLITVHIKGETYVIIDIGMRMLQPHELYKAQGFPDDYKFDVTADGKAITKTGQVRMCGNSVCPPIAEAIVRANYSENKIKAA
ncbi:MAG: DNA cytosine methyltransferase [Endomicrobium sp.]|jgi:DNA (cytosine-5)-methyltransferase 1|nr:DNA cytosine methyltransferase [Endomicrobium sp.]